MSFSNKILKIKKYDIPSKIFFAPINPGYSYNGTIDDRYTEFFIKRAGNGIGICYIGNVAIDTDLRTNEGTAVLLKEQEKEWMYLTNEIRSKGSIPGIQLAWKPVNINMQRNFFCEEKNQFLKIAQKYYEEFVEYDFIVKRFVDKIEFAKSVGFDLVQIHAAHGYALSLLLSQYVSRVSSPRENKGYKIIEQIINLCKTQNLIFDIRISLYEGWEAPEKELEYKETLFKLLLELGVDMISLSNGFYNLDKNMIYPPKLFGPVLLKDAIYIAHKYPNMVWNVAGNMEQIDFEDIPENLSISIGRQLLVDPLFITKVQNGTKEEIIKCTECNRCHYYSNMLPGIIECNVFK